MQDWQAFFDQPVDRRHSSSFKWQRYAGQDVLALWLADMEFQSPPSVIAALQQRVAHGVFGYTQVSAALTEAVLAHLQAQYHWSIEPEWLVWLPGLVPALHLACRALAEPQQGVITATPIYPPFMSAPKQQDRLLQRVALIQHQGQWQFDWDALEQVVSPASRLLMLCHPHNPVGRAWTLPELQRLAEWAERHQLWVCSDEVHCDLLLDGRRHRPFALVSDYLREHSITLMSPSKTFNLAGLACAVAVIPNAKVRKGFRQAAAGVLPELNLLGLTACEAALTDRSGWLPGLLDYLQQNRDYLYQQLPALGLSMSPVEATYLAWLDARSLQLEPSAQTFFEQAGVGLSNGADFGLAGFLRLNFACSRRTLEQAVERMRQGLARR